MNNPEDQNFQGNQKRGEYNIMGIQDFYKSRFKISKIPGTNAPKGIQINRQNPQNPCETRDPGKKVRSIKWKEKNRPRINNCHKNREAWETIDVLMEHRSSKLEIREIR